MGLRLLVARSALTWYTVSCYRFAGDHTLVSDRQKSSSHRTVYSDNSYQFHNSGGDRTLQFRGSFCSYDLLATLLGRVSAISKRRGRGSHGSWLGHLQRLSSM